MPRVNREIVITGGFWVVKTILSIFFTYFLSCSSTFVTLKLSAVVATEGIWNISVNLCYHVPNFKFRWGFRSIEGKDVGLGVHELVIFPYCNLF